MGYLVKKEMGWRLGGGGGWGGGGFFGGRGERRRYIVLVNTCTVLLCWCFVTTYFVCT